MSKGQAMGLNVVRAWATASSQPYALQPSPGNFSEGMFRGLDYALDQARQYNLKVSKLHIYTCMLCIQPYMKHSHVQKHTHE